MEPFNENLRGASVGDHKDFDVEYPADYPDAKLAGKNSTIPWMSSASRPRSSPNLNDEFAKDVSDATSLDELKNKIHEGLEHERDHRQKELSARKSSPNSSSSTTSLYRNPSSSIKWMCASSAWCVPWRSKVSIPAP